MTGPVPGTAAFGKFIRILQFIADQPGRSSVAEIAAALRMPRTTVHRIVAALQHEGLVEDKDGLGLGLRLVSLAWRSLDQSGLRQLARPSLDRLNAALDETVHLAVNSGAEMVYLDKLESRRAVRMTSRLGTRVTLHASAVGKSWLAAQPDAVVEALIPTLDYQRFTPHTIATPEALRAEIAATRHRGYALDLQERELDICCYGMAVVTAGGVQACVSVSLPRYRFEDLPADRAQAALSECVRGIAAALGGARV